LGVINLACVFEHSYLFVYLVCVWAIKCSPVAVRIQKLDILSLCVFGLYMGNRPFLNSRPNVKKKAVHFTKTIYQVPFAYHTVLSCTDIQLSPLN